MKLEVKNNFPLNSFKPCKMFECAWFTQIRGTDPNSGEEKDDHACAIAWFPLLTLEGAAMQRQTSSSIDSFRNEMVKANDSSRELLIATDARLLKNNE